MSQTIEDIIGSLNIGGAMSTDQYIEHEIQIRIYEHRFKIIESKLNWIISLIVGGMILPIVLHLLKLV